MLTCSRVVWRAWGRDVPKRWADDVEPEALVEIDTTVLRHLGELAEQRATLESELRDAVLAARRSAAASSACAATFVGRGTVRLATAGTTADRYGPRCRRSAFREIEIPSPGNRGEPVDDEVVARELPELLELAEAFPASPREPLLFPPFAGGPVRSLR